MDAISFPMADARMLALWLLLLITASSGLSPIGGEFLIDECGNKNICISV
jgi:hypothetical protein